MASSAPDPGLPADAASGLIGALDHGRRQFLDLVKDVRPELHRYCTRMTGSVADGEDVVQDVLARACYELPEMAALPALRPWLFRMAHNRAIDHWRHEAYRVSDPLDEALDIAADPALEPDQVLARHQAVGAALSSFLVLAPAQRGCVILKDVLGHSIEEIAQVLQLSVPAVKAALHRGRTALLQAAPTPAPAPAREVSPRLLRYAHLFNAHDWDGVRELLADDVQLDLVSRRKAAGRRAVGSYFSNYDSATDWRLAPGWLDGREVLFVMPAQGPGAARYFMALSWKGAQITRIRDFRYVPYILQPDPIEPL